jgi:hypothetical protein
MQAYGEVLIISFGGGQIQIQCHGNKIRGRTDFVVRAYA